MPINPFITHNNITESPQRTTTKHVALYGEPVCDQIPTMERVFTGNETGDPEYV